MNAIRTSFLIDTVITHTAPSHCELFSKSNLNQWAMNDPLLIEDIQFERKTMDMLLRHLKTDNLPISYWYYGHFHQSWHSAIDGILYQISTLWSSAEYINLYPIGYNIDIICRIIPDRI